MISIILLIVSFSFPIFALRSSMAPMIPQEQSSQLYEITLKTNSSLILFICLVSVTSLNVISILFLLLSIYPILTTKIYPK